MEFIKGLHGGIRWLIVLVALIGLIRFGLAWAMSGNYTKKDRILMSTFTGLIDLNLLLGLILLISGGFSPTYRIEHAGTMIIALVIAHIPASWRKRESHENKFRNNFLVILAVSILIYFGVSALPTGWPF